MKHIIPFVFRKVAAPLILGHIFHLGQTTKHLAFILLIIDRFELQYYYIVEFRVINIMFYSRGKHDHLNKEFSSLSHPVVI